MVNNVDNPDEALEVIEMTIEEVLTPNQAQDKENLRRIRADQEVIMEAILGILDTQTTIKAQLALMTNEDSPI